MHLKDILEKHSIKEFLYDAIEMAHTYECGNGYLERQLELLSKEIDKITNLFSVLEWNKYPDIIPPDYRDILVCVKKDDELFVMVSKFSDGGFYDCHDNLSMSGVSFWANLPEPPENEFLTTSK